MKKIIPFFVLSIVGCGIVCNANAQATDMNTVGDAYVASPAAIAAIQNMQNGEIDYMIENYSQPELAQYAVEMYKAEVRVAKQKGTELPPKPTKEMLADKQKIGEYLRSFYKFSY
ncbi:MAG: hypothetical protein IJ770_00095 [Alphaproteobacteria bacterium]|nr:hypothetical protein [Alphaproteobacteria bacterium]